MNSFVKYFLKNKAVTWLILILVIGGGLFSYAKMGKLEDAPFTIKQALVLTPYPGASPSEVQTQVTDVLEEAIQSMGELYYLKTENRAGISKITVYVKKEIRADEMQQLWDKLRRKVGDVQSKLPAGAGPSVVNDDFGDVLGVFYGITGDGRTWREMEDEAKRLKNELLKVKDVARVEIYGVQTPTIDVTVKPSVMAGSGLTTADIARAFAAQNKVVDAGAVETSENRIRIDGQFLLARRHPANDDYLRDGRIFPAGGHRPRGRELQDSYGKPYAYGRPAGVGSGRRYGIDGQCGGYGRGGSRRDRAFQTDDARRVRCRTDLRPGIRISRSQPGLYPESDHFRHNRRRRAALFHRREERHSDRQRAGLLHFCHADGDAHAGHRPATHVARGDHHCDGHARRQCHRGVRFGTGEHAAGNAQARGNPAILFFDGHAVVGCYGNRHSDISANLLLAPHYR